MAINVNRSPSGRALRSTTSSSHPRRATSHPIRSAPMLPAVPVADLTPLFPIVGIGVSAGGLEALQAFCTTMPATSGIAFVVISHQPYESANLLPTLLARCTTVPIHEVTRAMPVVPDHLYLAAPGTYLALLSGTLQPMAPDTLSNPAFPIDYFLQTLAEDRREQAIGIVLSGTGTDGTLGLQAIKRHKGMTMVQDEQEAQFPQMPRSARATGVVDHALPVSQMSSTLLAFVQGADAQGAEGCGALAPLTQDLLRQIYALLRDRTKHNFSSYKPMPICRSIERRMRVHRLDNPQQYLQFLHEYPAELDLLCRHALIGVTRFFRDPDAFASLAPHVQQLLLRAHTERRTGRVWVAGCATGEEAYSLAIMLQEGMEHLGIYVPTQIFATDLDSQNIAVARAGTYPKSIANDVSPTRLERFFDCVDGGYSVHKELRNMVVFATHNLLADPPFTQLDLLSCRNVLIYLQPATQRQLLSVFHYALLPHSYLLLGSSESIDGCVDRLTPLDTHWRIFQRQEAPTTPWPAVDLPPLARQAEAQGTTPRFPAKRSGPSFVMAIERLLTQRFAPPSVLVDSRGEVIYIHGRTGQFLQPAHGLQMRQHLLSMVHEGLQLELAMALSQATSSQESIRTRAKVETPSGPTVVEVTVQAVTNPELLQGLSLVTFHAHPPVATQPHRRQRRHSSQEQVITLEHELQQLQETLLGRTQAAYIFNEELQATNEEWQAANEELQSAKEEMESLNEELQTVNSELREKVQSLAGANDDLQNLLNATGIATLFLDSQLHIKRFTPQVTRLIKMIPSDVGRPIGDLVSTLAYDRLEADAQEVLETLLAKEMLVVTHDGEWYGVRMVPYRTSENAIDGIIITFIDISRFKVTAEV